MGTKKKKCVQKVQRIKTKQPGVYKNSVTNKYDVKYCYTIVDMATSKKKYMQKWYYGINSYKDAVSILNELKGAKFKPSTKEITLKEAFELWKEKAIANQYSLITIRNTSQQCDMLAKFISLDIPIILITEEMYFRLIAQCRDYGYSEETVWNINACLRKLINIAYKNRYISENPIDFWDSPRIANGIKRNVITKEEFEKINEFFDENYFYRIGENHYPKYKLLVNLLYYTGMRIGEVIALVYSDFETYSKTPQGKAKYMRVNVNKSYNSAYRLLKGIKNNKSRKIPLPEVVIEIFNEIMVEHLRCGGSPEERIFDWQHNACTVMIQKACREKGLREYTCHDFRHTYISRLIRSGVPIPVIEAVSGDTQATIFKRYSHMFQGDEELVLIALDN